jgi:hypothetical protein
MKKNHLLFVAVAVLFLASCSNDVDKLSTTSDGKQISLKTWSDKTLKSGKITQLADVKDFAVAAWVSGKIPSIDGMAATVLINGVKATGDNTNGWVYSPTAFWPESDPVDFYAYSPFASTGVDKGTFGSGLEVDGSATTTPVISYVLPGHTESTESIADQEDLLIAHHQGTALTEYSSGVPLTFRHALSRVTVQAKSEGTAKFVVTSLKLMNVLGKATLDLSTLPRDATALPYATDATVGVNGYATYWQTDATSGGDLSVDFDEITTNAGQTTETKVDGVDIPDDAKYYDVTTDESHALYVIPQTFASSDLVNATVNGSSSEFYIEITYYQYYDDATPDGPSVTYAVPVPAIVGPASASSIAFEMQKQYTFQFELIGNKPIVLKSIDVQAWEEVTPPQELPLKLTWAGSNIYYDATAKHLTFADSNDDSKKYYQGVFFQWGSLTGISPIGAYSTSTITYPLAGEAVTTSPAYEDIPYVTTDPGTYDRTAKYLTETVHDPSNGKGDICKYLTDQGYAPKGKKWRMPTSAESEAAANYSREPASGTLSIMTPSSETDGSFAINQGYIRDGKVFFPADGYKNIMGVTSNNVGIVGNYWSSSPANTTDGFILSFNATAMFLAHNGNRQLAMSVRCVAE